MRHELDGGNMKCSCKGGGCKICGASNQLAAFHNDLMKFGLSKSVITENLADIKGYLNKIDTFTLYEYLSGEIDKAKFDEALENFIPSKKNTYSKKSEVADFKPTVNPGKGHKFTSTGAWARCQYCNCIYKYCGKEDCPMYKGDENVGTTDVEN